MESGPEHARPDGGPYAAARRGRSTEAVGARADPHARPNPEFALADPNTRNQLHDGSLCVLVMPAKVVPIQVHHLVPCGHKVFHELLPRSGAGIDLCERTQL